MATSPALKKAINKYQKEKVKQVNLKFFPGDMDLLEYARAKGSEQGSLNGYIKDLIKKDMAR